SNVSQGVGNTLIDTSFDFTTLPSNGVGFELRNDAQSETSNVLASRIVSADTVNRKGTVDVSLGGQTMGWTVGNAYSIRRNAVTLDQPGRASGDTLLGVSMLQNATNSTQGGTISPKV